MSDRPAKPKEQPIGGSRKFRRLEERATTTAPLPQALVVGLVLGALGGLGAGAWEAALLIGAGIAYGPAVARVPLLVAWAGGGALLGLLGGLTGLWGPRWASATAFLALGWLASAKAAHAFHEAGVPGVVGFAVVVGAAFVIGQLAGRLPAPAWAHQGAASLAVASLAVVGPLQLDLLSRGTAPGAVVISLVAVLFASALAGVSAVVTAEGRPPLVPLLAFLSLGTGAAVVAAERAPPVWDGTKVAPPVVVIDVSGLRADRTGVGGYERPTTPNLDALAKGAIAFDAAHATSNWSVPSLASMLTGRLPYAHGAGLNDGRGGTGSPLRPDVRTLAQALRAAGIATAAVVADPKLRAFALDAGFQVWRDDPPWGARPLVLAPLAAAGLSPFPWPIASEADRVTDAALALVAAPPPSGWFLLVQYADVASPLRPTRADEEAVGFTTRRYPNDRYDAAVHRVDREIGRLVAGLPADAWIFVLGDRGTSLGEERPGAPSGRKRAPFGATMFEEMLHVPLVVRAPGVVPGHAKEPVSLVDLAPTVLQVAGIEGLTRTDGLPLARAFGTEPTDRPMIAQSSLYGLEQQAVIVGRSKVVQTSDGHAPLYDLLDDPHEDSALRKDPELDALQKRLLAILPPAGAGVDLQAPPPLLLQVGQVASRFATGGPPQ